jgi:hypothetical protein
MNTVTLRAHFDGQQIVVDEPYRLEELKPNTPLLITAFPHDEESEEREAWLRLSLEGLNRAYSEDEPEYSLDRIIEANPEYEGR